MDTHAQREKPPSSGPDVMSTSPASKSEKELKEEMLNRKMEEMKRKNEEMMKKHKLIEEDKRLAEQQGRSVTVKASKKENSSSSTTTPEENKKTKSIRTAGKDLRESITKQPQRVDEKDANKLSPPPDPSYNFLADRSREGPIEEERKEASRRHPRNFGGTDFEDVPKKIRDEKAKHMNRPLPREQIEYTICTTGKQRREMEEWRKEREKIDRERLERQKTNTGDWKRDWDKEKQSIDDLPYQQQYDRTNVPFRNKAGHDNYNSNRDFNRDSFAFNEPDNRRPAQNRNSFTFDDPSRRPDRDPFASHATASHRRPMPDRDSFAFREMTSNQRPPKDRDSCGPHETTSNHRPMQDRDFGATSEANSNRRPVQDRDSSGTAEPNRRSMQDQDPFTRLETTSNRRPLNDRKSAGRVGSGRFALEQMSKSQNVKKVSPHYGSRFKLGTSFGSDDSRPNKYTAGSTHQDYYNNKTRRGYGRAQRNKDQNVCMGRGFVTIEDRSVGVGDNIHVHPVLGGDEHRTVQENQETIIVQIDNKPTTVATQQKPENVQAVKIENSGDGDNLGSGAVVPACRVPKELRTEKPVGSGRFGTQALGRTTRSPKQDQIQTDELESLETVKVGRSNKRLGFRTTRGASGRIQNVHVDRGEMNTAAQEFDSTEKSDIEKVARVGRVGKSNLKSRNTRGPSQRMDKEHFEEYDNPEKITRVGRSGKLNAKLGSRTTRGRRMDMADDVAQSEEHGVIEATNKKCQENVENPDTSKVQSGSKKVKKVGFILDAEVIEPPKIHDDGSDVEQMSAGKFPDATENEKVEEVNIGEDFGEDDDDDDWEDIDEEVCLELDHGLEASTKDDSCSSQDISSESFDRFIKENTLQQKELEATKTGRDLASLVRPSSFQAILDWGAEMDSVYQLSEEENRNDDASVSSGNTTKRDASAREDDPSAANDKLQHPDLETHEIQMEGFHPVICSSPMATPLETNFNISAFEASESVSEKRNDLESVNFEKSECSAKVALDFGRKDGESCEVVEKTENFEGADARKTESFVEKEIPDSNLDSGENCGVLDSDSKKTENFEQTKILDCVSEITEKVKQDEILDSVSKQTENLEKVQIFDSGCDIDSLQQPEILHSVSENNEQAEILDSVSQPTETFEKNEMVQSVSENTEQDLDSVPKQTKNSEQAEIVNTVSENVEQVSDSVSKQTGNFEQVEILDSVSQTAENLEKKEIGMTKNVEDSYSENSGNTEKFEEDAKILDSVSDKGENSEKREIINSVPEIVEKSSEGNTPSTNLDDGEEAVISPTVSENLISDDTNLTENSEDCKNLKTYHEENNRGDVSELTESSDNGPVPVPDSVQSASEETIQKEEMAFPVQEGHKDSFVNDSRESDVGKSELETTDENSLSGQKERSSEDTNSSRTTD